MRKLSVSVIQRLVKLRECTGWSESSPDALAIHKFWCAPAHFIISEKGKMFDVKKLVLPMQTQFIHLKYVGRWLNWVLKADRNWKKGEAEGKNYGALLWSRTRLIPSRCTSYEPRQANLCLRAFRHDKFQPRMPSHSEGPRIWLSVWRFLLIHCLYERAAKVLARLRGCAGSPEPSLLA